MSDTAKVWAGEFGDEYHKRSPGNVDANEKFFDEVLFGKVLNGANVIEFGAGTGANLEAISRIFPDADLTGVEINPDACMTLMRWGTAIYTSMLEFVPLQEWDVVLSKGLLIHIPPGDLPRAYEVLHKSCKPGGIIVLAEYFSPRLEEVFYRGQMGLCWKGPHAYDMLDRFDDLKLVDYGFASSRDPDMPQDDLNWWVLEKKA